MREALRWIVCILCIMFVFWGGYHSYRVAQAEEAKEIQVEAEINFLKNIIARQDMEIKRISLELENVRNEFGRYQYLGEFEATAYSIEEGGNGRTATGTYVEQGRTIAVDPSVIPLGSRVRITSDYPGVSGEYLAEDTGSGIKNNTIDIYMDSYQDCINFGRRTVSIEIMR